MRSRVSSYPLRRPAVSPLPGGRQLHRPVFSRRVAPAHEIGLQPWRIVANIVGCVITIELDREPSVLGAFRPAELKVVIGRMLDVAVAEAIELGISDAAAKKHRPAVEI